MKKISEGNMTRRFLDVGKYFITDTDETIFVRHFSEVELGSLKELDASKVSYIEDHYWVPDGFIAWNIVDSEDSEDSELQLVYFTGRTAVITVFNEDDITRELLNKAMITKEKKVVRSLELCA